MKVELAAERCGVRGSGWELEDIESEGAVVPSFGDSAAIAKDGELLKVSDVGISGRRGGGGRHWKGGEEREVLIAIRGGRSKGNVRDLEI